MKCNANSGASELSNQALGEGLEWKNLEVQKSPKKRDKIIVSPGGKVTKTTYFIYIKFMYFLTFIWKSEKERDSQLFGSHPSCRGWTETEKSTRVSHRDTRNSTPELSSLPPRVHINQKLELLVGPGTPIQALGVWSSWCTRHRSALESDDEEAGFVFQGWLSCPESSFLLLFLG